MYVQVCYYANVVNKCVLNKYMYGMIVLCVPSFNEMDCLREETVPVPGGSGVLCSVASTRK